MKRKHAMLGFVMQWAWASALGAGLALMAGVACGIVVILLAWPFAALREVAILNAAITLLQLASIAAVAGWCIGWAQAKVLRRRVRANIHWRAATGAGAMVGAALACLVEFMLRQTADPDPTVFLMCAALGGSIGFAQWLVLRDYVAPPRGWVVLTLAKTFSWMSAPFWTFVLVAFDDIYLPPYWDVIVFGLALLFAGIFIVFITFTETIYGLVLAWLLRDPSPDLAQVIPLDLDGESAG